MSKIQRSWELFKSSLVVMRQNRKLLVFPIFIAGITTFIALLFMAGFALQPTGHPYTSAEHWQAIGNNIYTPDPADAGSQVHHRQSRGEMVARTKPLAIAYFAVTYFVSMFCATFLNVAFYKQILNALKGEEVSMSGGLSFACSKWKAILMWTLFAGIVGYIIRSLEERFGLVGRFVLSLLGTAWSIACVFVIPVLITDESATNPITVLKKSALTLRETWGESLIGYAGVSIGSGLIMLFSLVWLGVSVTAAVMLNSWLLGAMAVAGWLITMIAFSYLTSIASQIFRCALYLYATEGTLPAPYNEEMMQMAWKVKKS